LNGASQAARTAIPTCPIAPSYPGPGPGSPAGWRPGHQRQPPGPRAATRAERAECAASPAASNGLPGDRPGKTLETRIALQNAGSRLRKRFAGRQVCGCPLRVWRAALPAARPAVPEPFPLRDSPSAPGVTLPARVTALPEHGPPGCPGRAAQDGGGRPPGGRRGWAGSPKTGRRASPGNRSRPRSARPATSRRPPRPGLRARRPARRPRRPGRPARGARRPG
jgi:hypothetical protein